MSQDERHAEQRRMTLFGMLKRRFPIIAEYEARDKVDCDATDYLFACGNIAGALLYSILFVPNFCVIDDRVYLEDGIDREKIKLPEVSDDPTRSLDDLQESYNWRDLYDYLGRLDPPRSDDDDGAEGEHMMLAESVAEAWRARLAMLYPDRKFLVRAIPAEETGYGPGVGFREYRDEVHAKRARTRS